MRRLYICISACLIALGASEALASFREAVRDFERIEGYLPLYAHEASGRVLLAVPVDGEQMILQVSLPQGLGAPDIGLDRLALGPSRLVSFQRLGGKIVLRAINTRFLAHSQNAAERRAAADSFASSILWSFPVLAEEGGRVLIDATGFALSDQHGIARSLAEHGQGNYAIDSQRSGVVLNKSFPRNTEIEALVTLAHTSPDEAPGAMVSAIVPAPQAITLRQRLSFIELPSPGYTPRRFHVGAGYYPHDVQDYATPFDQPLKTRVITRHRLHKKDPHAPVSEPVQPIVYYLDPGIPEPVRGAIEEGASWWNEAFEAAGYRNAFQVKPMPPDMDPADARYNVINWVHRATRGYSHGDTVVDPRTGEIIRAVVTMGSLRLRQNALIARALMAPYADDGADAPEVREFALARVRQLAGHEVGHSLGLAHASIASTGPFGRGSFMDDPHPEIRITPEGNLDFTAAYARGAGAWDKVTIRYGYTDFPPGTDERAALDAIIDEAAAQGVRFLSHHRDSRTFNNAHLKSHLWDNGTDAVAQLEHLMQVRAVALDRFSHHAIRIGEPLSTLEEVLVPLYYFERYQLEAAAKHLGGMEYYYDVRAAGMPRASTVLVDPAAARRALDVILRTLDPSYLALPERILELIPPKAVGDEPTRESFPRESSDYLGLDPLAIAESSANHTLWFLLHPARLARVVEWNARDARQISLDELLDRATTHVFPPDRESAMHAAVRRRVQHVFVHRLMLLADDARAAEDVRAHALVRLRRIESALGNSARGSDAAESAAKQFQAHRIARFLAGTYRPTEAELAQMPPGEPI